jgi:ankyrin repeat protein
MRLRVRDFGVLELCEAAGEGRLERVENLLALGVDPNARFDDLQSVLEGVEVDWASGEKNTLPPRFHNDFTEEPPLRWVSLQERGASWSRPDKTKTTRLMSVLLQHGADPYALYRQRIRLHKSLPTFPGQSVDQEQFDDEELDLNHGLYSRWGIIEKSQRMEIERFRLEQASNPEAHSFCELDRIPGLDHEHFIDHEDRLPHPYGVCSVIHSMLEAGMFVQPVFDFLGDRLDVERRDPQGRTLFLAACLSSLGLDGAVDGDCSSLAGVSRREGIYDNPFPQPNNPWIQCERPNYTTRCTGPSLLQFFVSRGANLLAVDNYGNNALHLIFDEDNRADDRPALNHIAIKYLIQNCPSLINQPNNVGIYPLHMALRFMGIAGDSGREPPDAPEAIYHVEIAVNELLSAAANPRARDSRGNTVLHYLAASKLGEKNHRVGHEQRRLLRDFLDKGADPKARNSNGHTALEIFLTTGNDDDMPTEELDDYEGFHAIGEEVLNLFIQAGYSLEQRNAAGQTLLHMVATLASERAYPWFKILQAKGLDPLAEDEEGNTPLDIAKENDDLTPYIGNGRVE